MAHYPADTFQEATEIAIEASNQLHRVINGDATTEITVEDDSKIPSVRKAQLDSMYFKSPIAWSVGTYAVDYLQLYKFEETNGTFSWWFTKSATTTNQILMTSTPHSDPNWTLYSTDYTGLRQVYKRLAAEAGFNLVDGSFEEGGVLDSADDVLWYQADGKYYSWGGVLPKTAAAGTVPVVGAGTWVDRADVTLRGELGGDNGSELVTHKTQLANFVSMTISELQDLAPIYPEQLGAVAYGHDVAAVDMIADSSSALSNAFSAAVVLGRKVVLTGRYRVNHSIVSHYIQYANTSLVIEGQTAWCALVFTSATDRVMLEIHGYRPILRNFRCENTPETTGWDTKTAIKITGREGIIDSVWFRGGWKEEIWGVDFSESCIINTNGENDPSLREGKTDNIGIGLRLNSCVNTNVFNAFHGYNSYVYRMGYLDEGETGNSIKPSSYLEEITWGCEGIIFVGLRSVRSMYGIDPNGVEVSHANCIIDLNKYRIAKLNGVSIKFTDCWLATDNDTPANSTVWDAETTASQISVQSCTFDAKDGISPLVVFNSAIQNINNNKFIKTRSIVTATIFQSVTGNIPIATDDIILPVIPVDQTAYFYGQNLTVSKHVGALHLGSDVYPASQGQLAIRTSDALHRSFMIYGGDNVASVWGSLGNTSTSGTPSSINAKIYIAHDASSGRSLNASGTINASGADYAEYMRKAEGCGDIKKGQIAGVNSCGELTDKYSESVWFCIKSTNPNVVGNDSWSSEFHIPPFSSDYPHGSTQYDSDLALHNIECEKVMLALNTERAKWDRIAFCGQVPILVDNATAGEYVIPICGDGDTISYELIKTPTIEQYLISVGKMLDSKTIIVKV